MKIDIEVFEIPGSILSSVKKCYIELLSDRLVYCHDYYVDIPPSEEDSYEGELRVTDKVVYKKDCIVGASLMSKRLDTDDEETPFFDLYTVTIPIANVDEGIEVSFQTLKKANDFHTIVTNYIFS